MKDRHDAVSAEDGLLLGLATLLMRWRKTIVGVAIGGAILGLTSGLLGAHLFAFGIPRIG